MWRSGGELKINRISMKYILLILLLSLLSFAIFFEPVAGKFPGWTDKATAIQTYFTILGFIFGAIGLYEVIKKINKKYEPVFLINGEDKILSLENDILPFSVELNFYLLNKGTISLFKTNEVYYKIIFPEELSDIQITDGILSPSGDKYIPKLRKYHKEGFKVLGGIVKTTIHPKRKSQIFTIKLKFFQEGKYSIQYYFSTENGFYPTNIVADIDNEPEKNLAEIKLIVKKQK